MSNAAAAGILVVDDDDAFRERLVRALRERGFLADGVASVPEVEAAAIRLQPAFAIVDLRLPGGTGLEVVRILRRVVPGARVVVLTGYGSIATALEAIALGAANYLTKPASVDEILAALQPDEDRPPGTRGAIPVPSLARVEWEHIQRVLADVEGNISEAARRLGIHRRSLQRKLAKRPAKR